ncbi:MAG: endolytic transglycosylase MltG [Clostridiales bacterium]|nr:endolytic transglycosylase MltG [Clostridiales bacterium]
MSEEKFKVTIDDDDYFNLTYEPPKPQTPADNYRKNGEAFEVVFDDVLNLKDDSSAPEYKGEIYFSNVKPGRKTSEADNPQFYFAPDKPETKKRKKKKTKRKRAVGLFFAVFIILSTCLSVFAVSCVNDILAFSRSDEIVTVTIPTDATTQQIIDILSENKLIEQKWFCKLYNEAFDYLKNYNKTVKNVPVYNSGVYSVEKNLGLEGYLTKFRESQISDETVTVVLPEGWSIYQICERLDKYGVCSKTKVLASIRGGDYDYPFLNEIVSDSDRTFKIEGYLYPDTYEFYASTDANSVIRKMLDRFGTVWTDEYQQRADELGYSTDEIITIASIIQREAANALQMPQISSVLHNRLNHPASWPTLGCDSTVNYVTSYIAPIFDTLQTEKFKTTYSTSLNKGLPPGPICNPGDDAINAALYPDNTNYYFFRHDNAGNIYLAATQAEHDANANKVLRANSTY